MTDNLVKNARAVFPPALDTLSVHDVMVPFIEQGGYAFLLGESEEYLASTDRSQHLSRTPRQLRSLFGSPEIMPDIDCSQV
ncbi:hypothetical protein FHS25_006185 [Rhizobium laguerreae]|jgi:hypothetical protein|uniref:Uncharacterized protein n=1 Tax=Rhizobium laguerreae TaxID=1076926 RepID=A0AAX2QFL0_9HYPH|nr:hypothetical protein [Rhizobium laguerreae]TCU18572.1 hypothetical protein EV131_11479 [Rhizobium laguerreae]